MCLTAKSLLRLNGSRYRAELTDTVIARLTSLDQSGDYAFDVPIKDPLAELMRVGGSYPWRLDNGFTTVLHLKNTINQPVFALVQVRYEGGSYNLERLPLAPFQTIAVDIKQLRDSQQKDIRDSVIPKEIEGGQLVWFEETVGSLIGRAEVRNVAEGVASSFSCSDPCPCPPASSNTYLTPGSSVGPMGGTAQFTPMEQRRDCRGALFGPYNRSANSTWSSSDTNVFTVSGGLVSCLQPGSGTVTAQFQSTVYGQWCAVIYIYPRPSAPVTVQAPTSLKMLSQGISTTRFPNPLPNGCPPNMPFGMELAVRYQVMDQQNPPSPIVGTMILRENLLQRKVDGQDAAPDQIDVPVTASGTTESNGTFKDDGVGACGAGLFGTATFTQELIIVSATGTRSKVRTNLWALTGKNGCGNMNNGFFGDINVTVNCP
jgi:hypothetical protein